MKLTPEERFKKEVEEFKTIMAVPRPGMSREIHRIESPDLRKKGIELSDIQFISPHRLQPNPLNEYPLLSEEEMDELVSDISEKGILVPLIAKLDNILVCGHNRRVAAIRAALDLVPVQRILTELTEALERDIMKSENDRRRGGSWSREKKEQFIQENFAKELEEDHRGGDRKSEAIREQKLNSPLNDGNIPDRRLNSPLISETKNLAEKIEKKSRGHISKASAKEIVARLRKEQPKKAKGPTKQLSEKDRKRVEKLRLQLRSLSEIEVTLERKLEKLRKEKKAVTRELKSLGQMD